MSMHLYGLTLRPAGYTTHAVSGSFSAPGMTELAVVRGNSLELHQIDSSGNMVSRARREGIGVVRCLAAFRPRGSNTHRLAIGSDSGKLVIVRYVATTAQTSGGAQSAVHGRWIQEGSSGSFGRPGCRRSVPGQYVCADPNGRAIMVAALEENRLFFGLSQAAVGSAELPKPIRASSPGNLTFAACATGGATPGFACLQASYHDARRGPWSGSTTQLDSPKKSVVFYDFDTKEARVSQTRSVSVSPHSNDLASVPGDVGPGGVLVFAEGCVQYVKPDHATVQAPLPRRDGSKDDAGSLVVSWALFYARGDGFQHIIQSEDGDLFLVKLVFQGDIVKDIRIRYFDTVPVSTAMCAIPKQQLFFCACETGDQRMYRISDAAAALGNDVSGSAPVADSSMSLGPLFVPQPNRSIIIAKTIPSFAPCLAALSEDLTGEGMSQVYFLCGRGSSSSLRVQRYGLSVEVGMASRITIKKIFTVPVSSSNPTCSYMLCSQERTGGGARSNIFEISTQTRKPVPCTSLKIDSDGPTVWFSRLANGTFIHVQPNSVKLLAKGGQGPVLQWRPPEMRNISLCVANGRQVILSLDEGDDVYYFELLNGQLTSPRPHKLQGSRATALALGRGKSLNFVAIGCDDCSVRVLKPAPGATMIQKVKSNVAVAPSSLLFSRLSTLTEDSKASNALFIGLNNGVMLQCDVDTVSGALGRPVRRVLGTKPVRLQFVPVRKTEPAVLAFSSRTWLTYRQHNGRVQATPVLAPDAYTYGALASVEDKGGLVCADGNHIKFFRISDLDSQFQTKVLPLRYTPRRMAVCPEIKRLFIVETDQRAVPLANSTAGGGAGSSGAGPPVKRRRVDSGTAGDSAGGADAKMAANGSGHSPQTVKAIVQARAPPGIWASCVRVVNPNTLSTDCVVQLDNNEAAFSVATVRFARSKTGSPASTFVAVGTAKDLRLAPRSHNGGYIRVYKCVPSRKGITLQFVHKTAVNDVPLAMTELDSKLLCGVGRCLRLYDLGRKKLLRKCENKTFPTSICSLTVRGRRVFVGDSCEGFHMVNYKKSARRFAVFAESSDPFYVSSQAAVDFNTVAGGDKFGNLVVARLPEPLTEKKEDEFASQRDAARRVRDACRVVSSGYGGESNVDGSGTAAASGAQSGKLKPIVRFHVGAAVTWLQKTALASLGPKYLLYATMTGALGAFVPLRSHDDIEFFSRLERELRASNGPLCGRSHLEFRSYYAPLQNCVDGDLCERFLTLTDDEKRRVAEALGCSTAEVLRRIDVVRALVC